MVRYCPGGDGEFEDWVERCPDCGRTLVDDPPAAGSPVTAANRAEPIVYLTSVPNEPLAQLWIQVLADEGIRAMAKAVGPGWGAWASAAVLEHEIHVLASDRDRARQVLDDYQSARPFTGEDPSALPVEDANDPPDRLEPSPR